MIKYLILALAFIIVSVIILFDPLKFSQDTKEAIVPLATLALAFAALLTIIYSQNQESRRKTATVIDEIIDWASEGRRVFSRFLPWTSPSDRRETKGDLGWITAKKHSTIRGAKIFGNKLLPIVKDAIANLDSFNDFLEDPPKEKKLGHLTPDELLEKCKESFIKVLEIASNLKIELNT